MRIYLIDKDYQAIEIDTGDAARRFLAWFAGGASPVLAEAIAARLWHPREAGRLGALADRDFDVAALRAEVVVCLRTAHRSSGPDGREAS